jgi:hypothetical protein
VARNQSARKERKRSKEKSKTMKLPTHEQAESYFVKYKVPANIRLHCQTVNKLALFLAKELKKAGEDVDVEIIDRLSLLHDVFKAVVIKDLRPDPVFKSNPTEEEITFWAGMKEKYAGMYETGMFAAVFQEEYPEFCNLVTNYGSHDQPTSTKSREEQIVHYADWRVFVDDIIPLQERIDDLRIRYAAKIEAAGVELWDIRVKDEFAVEASICTKINIPPENLKERAQ